MTEWFVPITSHKLSKAAGFWAWQVLKSPGMHFGVAQGGCQHLCSLKQVLAMLCFADPAWLCSLGGEIPYRSCTRLAGDYQAKLCSAEGVGRRFIRLI